MARYKFTKEDCVKGGKARAAQPSFPEACSKGFWSCADKHPFFFRKYLKKKINAYYKAKDHKAKAQAA